ncbi:hypothetical protein NMG60_11031558 [Bertholletia excelsa]
MKSHKALQPVPNSLQLIFSFRLTMEMPLRLLFFCLLCCLLFQGSNSKTVIVDGVSDCRNPTVHIGDSIIFKHKYNYSLYIFQNRDAFNLCNFTRATLLTKSNSTYTWHLSRPGFFYFSFSNGSAKECQGGQKLAINVYPSPAENPATSPGMSPMATPAPISGEIVSASPTYPWPSQPQEPTAPSLAPTGVSPTKGSAGIPFINSNPAVPLPTGEVDSATIRPFPTSDHGGQVVGLLAVQTALCFVVLLLPLLV